MESRKNRNAIFTTFRHLRLASPAANGDIELTLIYTALITTQMVADGKNCKAIFTICHLRRTDVELEYCKKGYG